MKDYAMYIASLLIFGSNGIFAVRISLSSAEIVCMRTIIGGAALLAALLLSKARPDRAALRREAGSCLRRGSASA